MKLLIISHTEHYKDVNGKIVGWGPTLTEINHLASIFEVIYHIGTFRDEDAPLSALPYTSSNIHFIGMPFTGGVHWYQKLDILWNAPVTLYKVFKTLKKSDVFQLRCPTGIGVYLIPCLTLFSSKRGWYKYAGNWAQENAPLGYAIQRWMLKLQSRNVTINGHWNNQSNHCYTFENPCLTEVDRTEGLKVIKNKEIKKPYVFCFSGRLEDPKGVRRIIEAFTLIKDKTLIEKVHLIGDGEKKEEYKKMSAKSGITFVFHGFLSFYEVFEIYKKSHFFLLPSSASEGFPKVISEAMNFGCIPIVSNVSSISQYVQHQKNGYVVFPNTSEQLKKCIETIIDGSDMVQYKDMMYVNHKASSLFTYERYVNRIKNELSLFG